MNERRRKCLLTKRTIYAIWFILYTPLDHVLAIKISSNSKEAGVTTMEVSSSLSLTHLFDLTSSSPPPTSKPFIPLTIIRCCSSSSSTTSAAAPKHSGRVKRLSTDSTTTQSSDRATVRAIHLKKVCLDLSSKISLIFWLSLAFSMYIELIMCWVEWNWIWNWNWVLKVNEWGLRMWKMWLD